MKKRIHNTIAIILFMAFVFLYLAETKDNSIILNEIEKKEENILNNVQQNEVLISNKEENRNTIFETNKNEILNQKNETQQDKIIGTIKINKINFEGTVYEGTNQDILKKGVGHFQNSPYLNGNVCLAAHNTDKFWANLKTLDYGDLITYESFLGAKEYEVYNKTQIDETDWLGLEDTNENILTLITCVKGEREKRLCVQAREKI